MLTNIKSKLILQKVVEKLKRKIKLKIFKHNKKLSDRLNIRLKDFKRFEQIKELNKNFDLNLNDNDDIKKLNFKMKFRPNILSW